MGIAKPKAYGFDKKVLIGLLITLALENKGQKLFLEIMARLVLVGVLPRYLFWGLYSLTFFLIRQIDEFC